MWEQGEVWEAGVLCAATEDIIMRRQYFRSSGGRCEVCVQLSAAPVTFSATHLWP